MSKKTWKQIESVKFWLVSHAQTWYLDEIQLIVVRRKKVSSLLCFCFYSSSENALKLTFIYLIVSWSRNKSFSDSNTLSDRREKKTLSIKACVLLSIFVCYSIIQNKYIRNLFREKQNEIEKKFGVRLGWKLLNANSMAVWLVGECVLNGWAIK